MSKGPGKIERAVVDLVTGDPDNAFTVEDACVRIYHSAGGWWVNKKHRVAVIRAASTAIDRGANIGLLGWGGRGCAVVLYTPDNLTSYGVAYIKCSPSAWWTDEHVHERLAQKDYQINMAPGGRWWCEVELYKAKRAGEAERVAEIEAEVEKWRQAERRIMAAFSR